MGYILPITHFQYNDYQQRNVRKERSPFELNQVFKATLDSKLTDQYKKREEDRKQFQELSPALYTPHHVHMASQKQQPEQKEQVFSRLTGKGRNFSESI
ncbi:hypothetical protein MUN89_15990 [Halobacillus salinarum]|uniref:Uncharacterized protein n=1 Tax=Halobacillus salinarum TaxID=2932257 RepID=A0ABY4EIF8_9BACI|nr:hypothetical protein [Halobacillus salinarum]UOQ43409.1 hypothetical protein MUN89_15990 [Halobacillus salinarum]